MNECPACSLIEYREGPEGSEAKVVRRCEKFNPIL